MLFTITSPSLIPVGCVQHYDGTFQPFAEQRVAQRLEQQVEQQKLEFVAADVDFGKLVR